MSAEDVRALRVLVSGVVLDQPMSGVRRHNQELLPRVARILAERGGELAVLAPRAGLSCELAGVRVLPSNVPSGPPLARVVAESRALAAELERARAEGRPFDVVHTAHLPAPRLPPGVARTLTVHDLRALELPARGAPPPRRPPPRRPDARVERAADAGGEPSGPDSSARSSGDGAAPADETGPANGPVPASEAPAGDAGFERARPKGFAAFESLLGMAGLAGLAAVPPALRFPFAAGLARRLVAPGMIARALSDARAVVTVSETVRASLLERFALPAGRAFVVPNAADHLDVLPRRQRPDAPILHVGHVEPRKNLELLVRALALDPGLPPLWLAGRDARGERARLERLARELGVEERVRFLGPVDDARLPELYAEAACVALPSLLEGFGIPALEAMRARAPLAVSTAGALVEVTGGLVPRFAPDDARACVRALREALAAPPAALERAAARAADFTWDRSAHLLAEVFARAARDQEH